MKPIQIIISIEWITLNQITLKKQIIYFNHQLKLVILRTEKFYLGYSTLSKRTDLDVV